MTSVNKNTIDLKTKEKLKKEISKLHYNEHCEIYNIIRKDTDKISENRNGVFINLKYLNNDTINKVQEFIDFCKKNKNLLKKKQKEHENEMKSVNNNVNENLDSKYDIYSIEKESLENIEISDNVSEDKFTFKNYIDKLTITSNKDFTENNVEKKKKIIVKKNKKLSGVNARLLKKCRNLNKHNNYIKSKKNYNQIETILEDSLVNYNLYESNSNSNIDQLSEDI